MQPISTLSHLCTSGPALRRCFLEAAVRRITRHFRRPKVSSADTTDLRRIAIELEECQKPAI